MQVVPHVYRLHIPEDADDGGVMHPGGTNIYFVGDPQSSMVMIDTGEHFRDWTRRILDFHAALGSPRVEGILITHGHWDHIGGVDRVQEHMDSLVRCHPRLVPRLARILGPQAVLGLTSREAVGAGGGVVLRALFTPGHEDSHVCYYMPRRRVLFTGDTILGASSTTVSDLASYMKSLTLLSRFRPRVICPGHGPVVTEATARVEAYIAHRRHREEQVLAALSAGMGTVDEIVAYVYPRNLRQGLRHAAARNIIAHLEKLSQDGRVRETPGSYTLV